MKRQKALLALVAMILAVFILSSCSEHSNIVGTNESGGFGIEMQMQPDDDAEQDPTGDDIGWTNLGTKNSEPQKEESPNEDGKGCFSNESGRDTSDEVNSEAPSDGQDTNDDIGWTDPTMINITIPPPIGDQLDSLDRVDGEISLPIRDSKVMKGKDTVISGKPLPLD